MPRKLRPYRHSHNKKQEIEKIIAELLESGFIQPSQSAFVSPVILVKKKDGSWRFCMDYRYLNDLTIKHDFPIPIVDDSLDELHAFKIYQGHYDLVVMPFGLSNAPTTFDDMFL
ncbi:hypothetical protein LIER_19701 [Lithospermum erythrorhizon]|uniref:Transposon Ty3-I Gag-Pol polyprotein n=1 Tax=Lithospermum erythrorhizon TaxID=34254 RepID=A0AAV3QIL4_LITER